MTMRISPATFKYRGQPELQIQLARNVVQAVSALPGVKSAAIATDVPLLGGPSFIMRFEGRAPVRVSQAPIAAYYAVTPGFFDAMGMRVLRGRGITERDTRESPQVVVINQTLAERYFPGQDPIGKRLEVAFYTPPNWREIVGIVKDVKSAGLDQDTPVQVFTAFVQNPAFVYAVPPGLTVLARTSGDPAAMTSAMRAAILGVDRSQPVYAIQPMTEVVSKSIAQRRLSLILLAFFAISALVLAAVGVYGVMSYAVSQRTNEIGIRMALGARQWQVLLRVEGQGMVLVVIGLAIGLVGTVIATRFMSALLFRVGVRDPLTFGIAAVTLVVVSLFACYLPARRAANVDPIIALRCE
jgi:putative ABC transport system permease protein